VSSLTRVDEQDERCEACGRAWGKKVGFGGLVTAVQGMGR